jgi:flagella basal body P-ring formation protein FlgA
MKFSFGCLLLLLTALPVLAVELPLRASAMVADNQVLLRDLLAPADAARLARLAGPIRLFRAPEPGKTRKVSRETLARLVGRQIKADQLRLSGARSVTISRKGVWIEPAEMEVALEDYLASALGEQPEVTLSFEKLYLPSRFMVAAGKIEHQVIPSNRQVVGSRRMTLITRVNGQVVANQSIRVELKASARVVVITSDSKRGETLSSSDLELREQDITGLDEPFFAFEPLLGKQLKQSVRLGQPLQRRQVEFPPLIRRGERVTIQARNPGLLLSAMGEARQNGELGEMIRVRNNSSQREILCQVKAAGLVGVEF